jgi:arabinofuranosyltransferase
MLNFKKYFHNKYLHIFLIISAFIIYSLIFFRWVVDDLYIYFRFVDNFVNGKGIAYNYGEHIEGFSSFLWFLILSLFGFLKLPLEFSSKIGSILIAVIILYYLLKIHGKLNLKSNILILIILTAFNLPFVLWSSSGFENMLYALLFLVFVYEVIDTSANFKKLFKLYLIIFFISLTRPEGFIFSIILLGYIFWAFDDKIFAIKILTLYLLSAGCFLLFRYVYFNDLLPNTYYAKLYRDQTFNNYFLAYKIGILYVLSFFRHNLQFLVPFLVIPFVYKKVLKNKLFVLLIIIVIVQNLFITYAGADWMRQFRFMVFLIPLISLLVIITLDEFLLEKGYSKNIIYGVLIFIIIFNLFDKDYNEIKRDTLLAHNTKLMALDLKGIISDKDVVANGSAGIVPYYMLNVQFIDVLGLADKYIAKYGERKSDWFEKYSSSYVFSKKPNWIIIWKAKDSSGLFSTETSSPAFKEIENSPEFINYELNKTYDILDNTRVELYKKRH